MSAQQPKSDEIQSDSLKNNTRTSSADELLTGYRTQAQGQITGSVFSIQKEKLNLIPSDNIIKQMQGIVPGLTVIGSGQPGEMPKCYIRGFGSFSGSTPLFIVDGVPFNALCESGSNWYFRRGFDLGALLYLSQGNEIYNFTKWWTDFWPSYNGQKSKLLLYDSWTENNKNASVPKATNTSNFSTNTQNSSYYPENGSFLRLRSLQVKVLHPIESQQSQEPIFHNF